jgi:hypothetical protein
MAVTLTQVLRVAKWSRDDFNNWKRRVGFSTKMQETSPGVAQELSRQNALEVAFLAAISNTGAAPYNSKLRVEQWLREEKRGKLPEGWAANPQSLEALAAYGVPIRNFAKADAGKLALNLPDAQPNRPKLPNSMYESKPATVLVLIDLAEIVRRIDALFEKTER